MSLKEISIHHYHNFEYFKKSDVEDLIRKKIEEHEKKCLDCCNKICSRMNPLKELLGEE